VSENRIITDTSELIKPPKDAFWDAPVSRRMYQEQLNKVGRHIADLWAAADTAGILLNFIMEKKLMGDQTPEQQRAEVEAYVEEKKAQLAAMRANAIGQVGGNEPSNG
jgi:hypothetical protein